MTRNGLKEIIKQVIKESPVKPRFAVAAYTDKMASKPVDSSDNKNTFEPRSVLSRAVNIIVRIKDLSSKIEQLESQVSKKDDESDSEYYRRVVPILKEKTQLEIDRLDLLLNFENLNK